MRGVLRLYERRPLMTSYLGYVALAGITRIASYNAPPSPDTGQYMYVGGEVLQGAAPYAEVANNKGPANYLMWVALRAVCGESALAVRIALLLATGIAAVAVAAYVTRHAGRAAGLTAGMALALCSSALELEGSDPNNAQFGLVAMACAWSLSSRPDRAGTLAAGALAALSALLNPAFAVVAPFVAWEQWRVRRGPDRWRGLALLTIAATLTLVPFAIWLTLAGALDDMRIQVFGQVGRALEPDTPGGGIPGLAPSPQPQVPLGFLVNLPSSGLWIAGFAGALIAARDRRLRPAAVAAALWMIVAVVRVEVASYSFPNQYVPGIAGISVAIGLGIASVWGADAARRAAIGSLVLAAPVWSAVVAPQLRQLAIPADQRGNSYAETAARFIRDSTPAGSTLTVVGYDPEVQWLADRRAPTRFFDAFGLSSRADYAAERRRDLFADPPDAIAAVGDTVVDRDVEELIASGAYTLAYDRVTRIWLRSR